MMAAGALLAIPLLVGFVGAIISSRDRIRVSARTPGAPGGLAGVVLLGVPLIAGFLGAPVLQAAFRSFGCDLRLRLAVDLGLVAGGALGAKLWRQQDRGQNWGVFVLLGSLVSLGVWAAADGVLLDIASWTYNMGG